MTLCRIWYNIRMIHHSVYNLNRSHNPAKNLTAGTHYKVERSLKFVKTIVLIMSYDKKGRGAVMLAARSPWQFVFHIHTQKSSRPSCLGNSKTTWITDTAASSSIRTWIGSNLEVVKMTSSCSESCSLNFTFNSPGAIMKIEHSHWESEEVNKIKWSFS